MVKKSTNNFVYVKYSLTRSEIKRCEGFSDLSDEDIDEVIGSLVIYADIIIQFKLDANEERNY